jgi:propionyl-CoA carboxylase alpha chain
MGDKISSKKLAAEAGVSTVPGHMGLIEDAGRGGEASPTEIGFPVMIKASAGGGGKGMRDRLDSERRGTAEGFAAVKERGAERLRRRPRLPREIRDRARATSRFRCSATSTAISWCRCSSANARIQRRNQKVIEEAPSPLSRRGDQRRAMGAQAVALAKAVELSTPPARWNSSLDAGRIVLVPGDEHPASGRASGDGARSPASIWSSR